MRGARELEATQGLDVCQPMLPSQEWATEGMRRRRNSVCAEIHGRNAQLLTRVVSPPSDAAYGPMAEYEERVETGRLRDDEHQRGIIHKN